MNREIYEAYKEGRLKILCQEPFTAVLPPEFFVKGFSMYEIINSTIGVTERDVREYQKTDFHCPSCGKLRLKLQQNQDGSWSIVCKCGYVQKYSVPRLREQEGD